MNNTRKLLYGIRNYAVSTLNALTKLLITVAILLSYIVMLILNLLFVPVQSAAVSMETFVYKHTKRLSRN